MSDDKRVHLPVIPEAERQVDRLGLWSHGMHSETLERVHDLATWLYTGLEVLMQKGVATADELAQIRAQVRDRLETRHWTQQLGFALNNSDQDKYTAAAAQVDCEARMHLCKGVCCWMDHPLQMADVREGVVRWDHGKPYWIRQTPAGQCVHHGADNRCGVFAARPLVCRVYDCSDDKRVWLDFAGRVPNTETIDRIQSGTYRELVPEVMLDPETDVVRTKMQVDPLLPK